MPPAQAVALLAAVEQIQLADQAREDLNQHIAYFRNNADFNGMQLANSMTAIQPLIIGENQASQQLANFYAKKYLGASDQAAWFRLGVLGYESH